ncbi:MAG: hypothetical protein JNM56_06360 [Planctomycetia bacterium]|nr:hypothetical protein [Planctomycetia bacterium]
MSSELERPRADLSAPAARPRLLDARQAFDGLQAKVRLLSFDLCPAILDHLGLLPALLWLFERYTARMQVRVHFRHEALHARIATTVETVAAGPRLRPHPAAERPVMGYIVQSPHCGTDSVVRGEDVHLEVRVKNLRQMKDHEGDPMLWMRGAGM